MVEHRPCKRYMDFECGTELYRTDLYQSSISSVDWELMFKMRTANDFFNWMCFLTWPCGYVLSLITCSWIAIIIVHLWKSYRIQNLCLRSLVNSLWFTDTKWQHRFWSTVAQVIAWCLMAPSHYLNQCWLINGVLWQSHECNFTSAKSLRGQWVKLRKNIMMKMGMILCTPWHHSHNEGELGLDEKKCHTIRGIW